MKGHEYGAEQDAERAGQRGKAEAQAMLGPTKPIAMVKKWKFPRNQNGTWSITRPWRSLSGM